MSRLCGIGLLLKDNEDHLEVEEVVKDGPAYLSGKVQPADIVTAVDSVRVGRKHGYGLDNVKKLILGLPDTSVTLRLVRSNQEFDAILTRAHPRTSTTILPLGAAKAPAHVVSSQLSAPANSVGALKQAGEQHDVQRCGGRFTVQTEYQAKMGHEMTLLPGQTVEVVRKHRTGWWEGMKSDGTKGWFPSNVLSDKPLTETVLASSDCPAPGAHMFAQAAASSANAQPDRASATKMPAATASEELRAFPHRSGARGGASSGKEERLGNVHDDTRIPAGLAKETIALLRELKVAAGALRGEALRQGSRQGNGGGKRCGVGALPGGGNKELSFYHSALQVGRGGGTAALQTVSAFASAGERSGAEEVEEKMAALRAEVRAERLAHAEQAAKCKQLEEGKTLLEARCAKLEAQLQACCKERDRALDELESIHQDPDLYLAGLASGVGSGGESRAGGAGTRLEEVEWAKKRLSRGAADEGNFPEDEQEVDFDSDEGEVDFDVQLPQMPPARVEA